MDSIKWAWIGPARWKLAYQGFLGVCPVLAGCLGGSIAVRGVGWWTWDIWRLGLGLGKGLGNRLGNRLSNRLGKGLGIRLGNRLGNRIGQRMAGGQE